jgi:signal transduction histidine kinase
MYIDDRLATVLSARAEGQAAMRIQYRQLIDLLGTSAAGARGELLDAAHLRISELAGAIPAVERARALVEPGIRLRNPRLVAELAAGEPEVAQAAICTARLDETQWLDLIPALPIHARGFVRLRSDLTTAVEAQLGRLGIAHPALPDAAAATAPEVAATPLAPADNVLQLTPREETPRGIEPPRPHPAEFEGIGDGIGALVRRIEAFRRNRETAEALRPANDAPRLPLDEAGLGPEAPTAPVAFGFATDAAGRVGWADPAIAAAVTGLLISGDTGDAALADTIRRRQPIRAAKLVLAGAPVIAGEWEVDATPQFDSAGHFSGYAGRFRRPAPATSVAAGNPEADRVRQILHELRTPVNAIQGFAEMIQQQLFGTAPHEYRALAASIAADAARMLAGFEELDRLARLETGALTPDSGACDLAMTVAGIVHQLEPYTGARGSGFTYTADAGALIVALAPAEAERLAWRLLATLAGAANPGETLGLAVGGTDEGAALTVDLPDGLARQEDLFDATPPAGVQALSAGVFGAGFALRLAAAEARGAGGSLSRTGTALRLVLPHGERTEASLTPAVGFHTPSDGTAASAR